MINQLLVKGAEAVRWLWDGIVHVASAVWGWIDALLNPLLSPLLAFLNPICTAVGDAVYAPLNALPPWIGLTLLSVLAGIIMLGAFRFASNQAAIGRAKDDIKANLLALKLFKDEIRVTFQSQWRILWAILRLQRYILTPVLVLMLPMLLGLAQMGMRHQWRPLRPGERANVLITLAPDSDGVTGETDATLEAPPGIDVEIGPIPGDGDLAWRVRAIEPGRHTLRFRLGDEAVEKEVVGGESMARVSAMRCGRNWTGQLLHPAEPRLPGDSAVASIAIDYPAIDSIISGSNYWVIYLFIISLATAIILRPLFKVRF